MIADKSGTDTDRDMDYLGDAIENVDDTMGILEHKIIKDIKTAIETNEQVSESLGKYK